MGKLMSDLRVGQADGASRMQPSFILQRGRFDLRSVTDAGKLNWPNVIFLMGYGARLLKSQGRAQPTIAIHSHG